MRQTLLNCALVIASALCLTGCEEHSASETERPNVKPVMRTFSTVIYSICIEGHDYIVFDGHRKGGIVHSAGCPCRRGDSEGDAERHAQEPAGTNCRHARHGLD